MEEVMVMYLPVASYMDIDEAIHPPMLDKSNDAQGLEGIPTLTESNMTTPSSHGSPSAQTYDTFLCLCE